MSQTRAARLKELESAFSRVPHAELCKMAALYRLAYEEADALLLPLIDYMRKVQRIVGTVKTK